MLLRQVNLYFLQLQSQGSWPHGSSDVSKMEDSLGKLACMELDRLRQQLDRATNSKCTAGTQYFEMRVSLLIKGH